MGPYKIILADDHVMLREGIKEIIKRGEDLEVIGEVNDGLELLHLLNDVKPDLVVLDISMPNIRGIEVAREISATYPNIKILMLTMHKDQEFLYYSFAAGAMGYLLKEDTNTELFSAIETIRKGGYYVSPYFSEELINNLIDTCQGTKKFLTEDEVLTTREREVLKMIAEGKSNKQIADLLFISLYTAQHHRASIMKKLKFDSLADLVKYAIRKKYTSELL